MSTINDYWSGRGESDHNAEWAGANPAEYWTRKYGEALNWKRGQAELEARRKAEELRIKMAEQKKKYEENLKKRYDAYQKSFEDYKTQFLTQSTSAKNGLNQMKGQLQQSAADQSNQLGGLLSTLLGKYDEGLTNAQGKFSQFKDYSSSLANQALAFESGVGNDITGLLSQTPQYYTPNLFVPDLASFATQAPQVSSLMNQGLSKFNETYGWNQDRLKQETSPYQSQFENQKQALGSSISNLGDSFINTTSKLYNPGLYDQSDYNRALSTEQSLSQSLRQQEQGVLSQLNDMFNYASTFANKAENAYNTEKANRLNERQAIQTQQQNNMVGQKTSQLEKEAAQQVTNRRQNTMMSFNPYTSNLISQLTRGY
jgi:hypothetical protein